MRPFISGIVIVKNEEARIGRCLESMHWLDEIVVVDSGSTDGTREICTHYDKVRFFSHEWEGFGRQKNIALQAAVGEWVLSVDADELVTSELVAEIDRVLQSPKCDGYYIQRKNFYRGKWIRHSGWWPDPVLRLFRRDKGRFSDRMVHESVELEGTAGYLKAALEHHSFATVTDFIKKADDYSTLGALMLMQHGRRASASLALLKSFAAFVKTLVVKRGFLDGFSGVLIAYSNATGVFYRYMKCVELRQRGASEP